VFQITFHRLFLFYYKTIQKSEFLFRRKEPRKCTFRDTFIG
jgi:hypothetical protein